jgi:hypothetical protein
MGGLNGLFKYPDLLFLKRAELCFAPQIYFVLHEIGFENVKLMFGNHVAQYSFFFVNQLLVVLFFNV